MNFLKFDKRNSELSSSKKMLIYVIYCIIFVIFAVCSIHIYMKSPTIIPDDPIEDNISQLNEFKNQEFNENISEDNSSDYQEYSSNDNTYKKTSPSNIYDDSEVAATSEHPSEDVNGNSNNLAEENNEISSSATNKSNSPINVDSPTVKSENVTDIEYFTASIKNGETVNSQIYEFSVIHNYSEFNLYSMQVYVNNCEIYQFVGTCNLNIGTNIIRISCVYTDSTGKVIRAYKDYTVYCDLNNTYMETTTELSKDKNQNVYFFTDAENTTIYNSEFSFFAYWKGTENGKVTCALNGENLKNSDGKYTFNAKIGDNILIIKAKYEEIVYENKFIITYSPQISSDKLPLIEFINIQNGQTVKHSEFPLEIAAYDSNNNRLYANNITVMCNNRFVYKSWENKSTTGYTLPLFEGENTISISISDSRGGINDYYYTIIKESVNDDEEIGKISITLSAEVLGLENIANSFDYPIYNGESGFDVVMRFLQENDFEIITSYGDNCYIKRLSKKGAFEEAAISKEENDYLSKNGIAIFGEISPDNLGEMDITVGSGWIYTINGQIPSFSLSKAIITDKDQLCIKFTLDYGNDLK